MIDNKKEVKELNSLLRGEISAAETYRQAIGKFSDELEHAGEAAALAELHQDHSNAAAQLRERVAAQGGKPEEDSGAWGTFAKTVEGTAKLFGDKSALKALKEGEEHGLKEYREAIDNGGKFDQQTESLITRLAASQQQHIATLDRLMNRVG